MSDEKRIPVVYKITWKIPRPPHQMLLSYTDYSEKFVVIGTKEKADEMYGRLLTASKLIGINIDLQFETLEVQQ